MQINLFPKDEVFYRMFREQADLIVTASAVFQELMHNYSEPKERIKRIIELESAGDEHTRNLVHHLNASFVTPVDREDIHTLAVLMDDILDLLQATVVRMDLYKVTEVIPAMPPMSDVIVKCADVLQDGVKRLPKFENLSDLFRTMQGHEKEGDKVERAAVAELFANCRSVEDVVHLMKWKEIVGTAEETVDKFKDVFELLQEIVIKHA